RIFKDNPPNLKAASPCESCNVISESGLESPLSFRALSVWRRRVPPGSLGVVALEILFHPFSSMMVLIRRGAAEGAKLKNMAIAEFRRRPLETTFNDEDGPTWFQALEKKILVRRPQPQLFGPKVRHPLDHQPVLIGIMQVVQLYIR